MERKKSPHANLEKKRFTFFQIGLVISLAIMLLAFECTRTSTSYKDFGVVSLKSFEEDQMPITYATKKPEPKIKKVFEIKLEDIVKNDDNINEEWLDINSEGGEDLIIEPVIFEDEESVETFDYYGLKIKPEFPGGMKGFFREIYSKIKYPDEAISNNITGTVFLQFIVNEKGIMDSISVVRGVHPCLDNEALRVLNKMSNWSPGINAGKTVRVRFSIPIKFELR